MTKATPFLMFQHGKAQPALDFYAEHVPDSRIDAVERFGPDGPGPEGTIIRAHAVIAGQPVMVHDSFVTHGFDFTPSWSFFLDCDDAATFDRLFSALSDGGGVLMPPGNYGWSSNFAWINDRFGVSWQLNLARRRPIMPALEILAPDTLRIERILDAPPATVWRYLVEADLRRKWFAGGTDARADAPVELVFDHDNLSADAVPYPGRYAKWKGAVGRERVVEYDPPHVFAISWDEGAEGTARFELFAEGDDKTRLVLTHSGITGPAPMANFGGGWHSHLAVLQGLLAGQPVRDFWALHAESEAEVAALLQTHG